MTTTRPPKSGKRKPPKKRPGRKNRPMGRPTMCTPEAIKGFCVAISYGATVEDAANYVGVTQSAANNWLARAREAIVEAGLDPEEPPDDVAEKVKENERPYVTLLVSSQRARAKGKVQMLATIKRAATGGAVWEPDPNDPTKQIQTGFVSPEWKAAAHILSIRDAEYTRHSRHDHQVSGVQGVPGVVIYLPEEEPDPA